MSIQDDGRMRVEMRREPLPSGDVLVVEVGGDNQPDVFETVTQLIDDEMSELGVSTLTAFIAPENVGVDRLADVPDEWLARFKSEWERRHRGEP